MADDKPSRRVVAIWALAIFVLAVCLRVPSCYESFWLDELHTAWAIWGDLGAVSQRAEAGNQTPLYEAAKGRTFLWYTTEMDELANCDHVYVFRDGGIVADLPRAEMTEQRVLHASFRADA